MRIVHLSTHDGGGGAARAASRLHVGLRQLGEDSSMLVRRRVGDGPNVQPFRYPMGLGARVRRVLRRWRIQHALARYTDSRPAGYEAFSDDRSDLGASVADQVPDCDVVNLHWVAGFVDYRSFFAAVPRRASVVWTLHDMTPFTGGCHYDDGCGRYRAACGACPQLGSDSAADLSRRIWRRKERALSRVPPSRLHIVTPSRWLAARVQESSLLGRFPTAVIPNGLDTVAFAPRDRRTAREALGVPADARILLFASQSIDNRRKGFALLVDALGAMALPDLVLMSVGANAPRLDAAVPCVHFGGIGNDRVLSLVYSAADVFVLPSIQDNLPNTVLESMACGTPVVGFDVGGIPDMVRPGVTGERAPRGDAAGFADAIRRLLCDDAARQSMAENCRRIAVEEYGLEVQARRYIKLYRSVLE
jgi:glycosyltransferase involved in cell wall biosynthesis